MKSLTNKTLKMLDAITNYFYRIQVNNKKNMIGSATIWININKCMIV